MRQERDGEEWEKGGREGVRGWEVGMRVRTGAVHAGYRRAQELYDVRRQERLSDREIEE